MLCIRVLFFFLLMEGVVFFFNPAWDSLIKPCTSEGAIRPRKRYLMGGKSNNHLLNKLIFSVSSAKYPD